MVQVVFHKRCNIFKSPSVLFIEHHSGRCAGIKFDVPQKPNTMKGCKAKAMAVLAVLALAISIPTLSYAAGDGGCTTTTTTTTVSSGHTIVTTTTTTTVCP